VSHRLDFAAPAIGAVDHVLGLPQAPVTVVEYADFECPTCKQAAPAVKIMLKRFPGRVRFVYRHFPLEELHPHALDAALAAEAAGVQGRFWPMHDLLFDNQRHLERPQLRLYAEQLGLDMTHYDADMANKRHLLRVREHIESGEKSGVRATPGFFINGIAQDVSFGVKYLMDGVEKVLRRQAEMHQGAAEDADNRKTL
jgi:protein-disulfide isomerase